MIFIFSPRNKDIVEIKFKTLQRFYNAKILLQKGEALTIRTERTLCQPKRKIHATTWIDITGCGAQEVRHNRAILNYYLYELQEVSKLMKSDGDQHSGYSGAIINQSQGRTINAGGAGNTLCADLGYPCTQENAHQAACRLRGFGFAYFI